MVATENKDTDGLDYDSDIASIFWSLSVPATMVPEGGARGISSKLDFCIERIKGWDPRLYVQHLVRRCEYESVF